MAAARRAGRAGQALHPQAVTLATTAADLQRQWLAPNGEARVQVLPKGDPNNTAVLRKFATAVLAVEPDATGPAMTLFQAGNTIVHAFIEAGVFAFVGIFLLLYITLRRLGDVLVTLLPLLLAAALTLELCVILDLPLNFANIIALPLLFGVGVAFKIYYVMAWRRGGTALVQSTLEPRRHLQRDDDRHRLRQPVAVEQSRNVEHGPADGPGADLHDGGGGVVPARADGPAATVPAEEKRRRPMPVPAAPEQRVPEPAGWVVALLVGSSRAPVARQSPADAEDHPGDEALSDEFRR